MRIVLDAMGSDNHPEPELEAAVEAHRLWGERLTLTGPAEVLGSRVDPSRVDIVDAPEILEMEDKPAVAARRKPNSSMAVGMRMLKHGEADAFVTMGNTGGALATALFQLGRIRGVKRPALSPVFPVLNGSTVVIDIGANTDCRPEYLLQFGIMGSIYAEIYLERKNPRVALLSTGEEQGKGNMLVGEADPLLRASGLNYIGNVEPRELYDGKADVVVTDGFSGNVFLKTSEAVAALLVELIHTEIKVSPITAAGGYLARPAFRRVAKLMDPTEYGAVPLLGVDGLVFIGHGRSNAAAVVSALRATRKAVSRGLMEALREGLKESFKRSIH
ncbi:MAG: phosphate acyltransferase PlsX [Anaerolineales bacterium]